MIETTYNATCRQHIPITPLVGIFKIQPDTPSFSFTPGQFAILGLPRHAARVAEAEEEDPSYPAKSQRWIRRAYSIASSSRQNEYLEFYISLILSGELTPRLFALNAGDRLFLGAKANGLFTLEHVAPHRCIMLVATGTGLAPYMSMLRSQLMTSPAMRTIVVLHGARHSWDLGYRAELMAFERHSPQFYYIPVISRPTEDIQWQGRIGRLNSWINLAILSAICQFSLSAENTDIFLCGHPNMVEEAVAQLTPQGFNEGSRQKPGNLHLERYW